MYSPYLPLKYWNCIIHYNVYSFFQDISDYIDILLPAVATNLHNASLSFEKAAQDMVEAPQQVI